MVGAHIVDGDAMLAQLNRGRTRQAHQPVFAGGIGLCMRKARFGRLAGDVDDAPAAPLRHHDFGGGLQAKPCAGQVHVNHRAPVVGRHVGQRLHDIPNAGVVDPYVQPAMGGHGVLGQRLYAGRVAHIAHTGAGRRRQAGGNRFHLVGAANHAVGRCGIAAGANIRDDDNRPLLAQAPGNRLAQTAPAPRTGDHRHLASKASAHATISAVVMKVTSTMSLKAAATACMASLATSWPNWSISATSITSI